MARSVKSVKPGLLLEPATLQTSSVSAGSSPSGRRKSVALRTGSFDEQQLLRAELASRGGASSTPNTAPHASPKFFRTQSFGDRLLASPKFVKSKKMFHSIGQKSSSSTVLFFPPESSSPAAKTSGTSFGSRRKHPVEGSVRAQEPATSEQSTPERDPLGAYREELRQLRQLQKERFRSRSSSISIERWNESATGQSPNANKKRCLIIPAKLDNQLQLVMVVLE
uniref:Uncharacterized protein n=1 Tax=Anopheles stephensi TaxID=30069 RepID=A0A182Y6F9_ANOST